MNDLTRLTISDLAPRLASREISSVELTTACLDRIGALNAELNAFITVLAEEALADARRADREMRAGRRCGPLHGVPISLKDLIDVAGVRTTAASRVRADVVADRDAPLVTALRKAGAVIVGKCNLHEFAFGTTCEESAFGPPRHPVDPARSPGGSSGGSAVAVVTGMSFASVGTDTGGSVRIPAAACGCVGLKPTFGELSCEGVVPLSRSLDHVGPLARTVADAAVVYREMLAVRAPAPPDVLPPSSLRLGLLRPYFMDVMDADVRARFDTAVRRLREADVQIDDVRVPHATDVATVYLHLQLPEAAAYHATAFERQAPDYQPGVRARLAAGRYVLAEDYVRAQRGRAVLRCEVDHALGGRHALVLPTLPIPAPLLGAPTAVVDGRMEPVRALMLKSTQLFNLTGHPAISIPCGQTGAGLPCGVQLVGRMNRTLDLIAVAQACEAVL
jgi:aspartyl-tRNA(Asn)/glutamyl-tRNA(Gln) amidotransferase subunit A